MRSTQWLHPPTQLVDMTGTLNPETTDSQIDANSSLEEQQLALQLSPANWFPVQDVTVNHHTHHQCTMQDGWYVEKKHYFIIFLSIANHNWLCLHIKRERERECLQFFVAQFTVHIFKQLWLQPLNEFTATTVHFLIQNTSLEFHQICPCLEDWVSHCYWRLGCWIIQVQSFQMAHVVPM